MKINTEKCYHCDGTGYRPGFVTVEDWKDRNEKSRSGKVVFDYILCTHCKGRGKIDWVRNVTGSRSNDIPDLEELTDEVHKLMGENNIFGVQEIKLEHNRKEFLKNLGPDRKTK
jgi:RecJ-like exonuclease